MNCPFCNKPNCIRKSAIRKFSYPGSTIRLELPCKHCDELIYVCFDNSPASTVMPGISIPQTT